jgi:hypothetical protein
MTRRQDRPQGQIQRAVFEREEEVRHWIEHGGPAELREIRVEMANLWRKGLIKLTRTEGGDFRSTTKHGTAVEARGAAVAPPGCHLDTLRRDLTRNSDGSASGPLVLALDLLAAE